MFKRPHPPSELKEAVTPPTVSTQKIQSSVQMGKSIRVSQHGRYLYFTLTLLNHLLFSLLLWLTGKTNLNEPLILLFTLED